MKNSIILTCLFSILIIGCQKENPEIRIKLISKLTTNGRNPSIKVFNYDDFNKLVSIEYLNVQTGLPTKKYEYTYKDNQLFTMDIYDKVFYFEVTHYIDSICLTRKYKNYPDEYLDYILYLNEEEVIDSVNMYTYNTQYSFILDNNNNILGYSHYEPIMNNISNFEYDNKMNAYTSLPIEYRFLNFINTGTNNVISYENVGEKISFSYEYDTENYPKNCIVRYQSKNDSSIYYKNDTLKFEYK